MEAITEATFRKLVKGGSVREVQVVADGREWYVVAKIGMEDQVVSSQRRQRRTWRSLDSVLDWLQDRVGVATFSVNASQRSGQKGAA